MGAIDVLVESVKEGYESLVGFLPGPIASALNVFVVALLIAIVALFIWYFYRSLSQRNLISLNLTQYNRSEHPVGNKLFAILLYFLEYIIIMPFLILVWFSALSLFVLLVASDRSAAQILTLTAAMIAAIRILAYGNGEISKDLAKLFPFITLSVFLLTPGAFDFGVTMSKLSGVDLIFTNIVYFLLVIFLIEIFLRGAYTMVQFARSKEKLGSGVAISK